MSEAQTQRIAFLARESYRDWLIRFHRERDMPEPSPEEIAEMIRLDQVDFQGVHQ